MGMGGIWEMLDGKIWEWNARFRWKWEFDGNETLDIIKRSNCPPLVPTHDLSRNRHRLKRFINNSLLDA